MGRICKNCDYFVGVSDNVDDRINWGNCYKSRSQFAEEEKKGLFKWVDSTCDSFKPKQAAVDSMPTVENTAEQDA